MTIVWDGLPSHRSKKMQAFLHGERPWLRVERLPGLAHELDLVDGIWGNAKRRELANLCAGDVAELEQAGDEACAAPVPTRSCAWLSSDRRHCDDEP